MCTSLLRAGALHPSISLTQETTLPLKQGSLALSSEISSLTTLGRGQTDSQTDRQTVAGGPSNQENDRGAEINHRAACSREARGSPAPFQQSDINKSDFPQVSSTSGSDHSDGEPFTHLAPVSYGNHDNLFHFLPQPRP